MILTAVTCSKGLLFFLTGFGQAMNCKQSITMEFPTAAICEKIGEQFMIGRYGYFTCTWEDMSDGK